MKSRIPTVSLLVVAAALAGFAYHQHRVIRGLQARLAAAEAATPPVAESAPPAPAGSEAVAALAPAAAPEPAPIRPAADTATRREGTHSQRVMRDFAKLLENPQMNEVMQASQRATLAVLYKDLLDAYQLTPEERDHLLDLLMARQMFRVETGMKMMGGGDADEMAALGEEMREYDQTVKREIDAFLNSPEDTATFEYYEKTMQERMALSGLRAELARAQTPLADGVERQLIDIMAREKSAHRFRSDLADETNTRLDAARFSTENINAFEQDLNDVHAAITGQARSILTADQLAAFTRMLEQMRQMQLSQIRMAATMFAGGASGG